MTSTTLHPTRTHKSTLPLFVAAESLSLFGNAAISIVLPWLVLSRTGDPSVAGLVAAVAAVPSILATLVGGWLIDHVGQRRMSIIADLGSALSVAGLAIVDWAFGLDIGWFIVARRPRRPVRRARHDRPRDADGPGQRDQRGHARPDRRDPPGRLRCRLPRWPGGGRRPAHRARPDPGGLDHRGLLRPGRALHSAAAPGGRRGRAVRRSAAARRPRHPVGQPRAAGHGGHRVRQRSADRSADHRPAARALPTSWAGGLAGLHHVGVRGRIDRRLDPLRRPRRQVPPPGLRPRPGAADRRHGRVRHPAGLLAGGGRVGHGRGSAAGCCPRSSWSSSPSGWPSGSAAGCSAWSTLSAWWPRRSGCR